jgi:cysteinyl-tRNA synthetase
MQQKEEMIRIYNTLSGKKEDFIPLKEMKVGMYVCGITAYDVCHLGHARSAIVFDMIRRYLTYRGFTVTHVRNITDIDDKIIARANEENVSTDVIAKKYTEEYHRDMESLGVGRADIESNATDHIGEMIDTVRSLMKAGYAYDVGGDVYYKVERFSGYGKLSKRNPDELVAGSRVEIDEKKKNPLDFVLWKSSKKGEPSWESPWGPGRPGWHLECAAMSTGYLGQSFDIHGGGADLIFPHHENEIAQVEALTDKPFVKYWMHNGFITVDKEKMSKSLGNFFTIREILEKYDPEIVRFFLLSTHYRSPVEFSDSQLNAAETSIDRYYSTVIRINDFIVSEGDDGKAGNHEALQVLLSSVKERFHRAMSDDFNTASALGHIFELLREVNRYLDSGYSGEEARMLVSRSMDVLNELGGVLNIFNRSPEEWYRSLKEVKKIGISDEALHEKIEERQRARAHRDWATADRIRGELEKVGILLEDKKQGTFWKIRVG